MRALFGASPPDLDQAVGRAGDAAFHQQQVPFGIDLDDLQSFNGYPAVSHVPTHLHAFVDPAGGGAAAAGTRSSRPL